MPLSANPVAARVAENGIEPIVATGQPSFTFERLRPVDLFIDHVFQRTLSPSWVDRIVTTFDWDLLLPIDVNRREDGTLSVMDGQHRYTALIELGMSETPVDCRVFDGLTIEQEAKHFRNQDRMLRMSPGMRFRAKLTEGDATSWAIFNLLQKYGYSYDPFQVDTTGGKFLTIGSIEEVVRSNGIDVLEEILSVASRAWGNETDGFVRPVVVGLASFFSRYGGMYDEDRLVRILGNNTARQLWNMGRDYAYRNRRSTIAKRVTEAIGRTVLDEYNEKLRTTRLPDWDEAAKTMRRESAKRLRASLATNTRVQRAEKGVV